MSTHLIEDFFEVQLENSETVKYDTVALENSYVKIVIALDMSGRILSIFDKRYQKETVPKFSDLDGIQFRVDKGPVRQTARRLTYQFLDNKLVLFDLIPDKGLSWHSTISLADNSAEISIELSLYNRQFTVQDFGLELRMLVNRNDTKVYIKPYKKQMALYNTLLDSGFIFTVNNGSFNSIGFKNDVLIMHLYENTINSIGPRSIYKTCFKIVPLSSLGDITDFTEEIAYHYDQNTLKIQSSTSKKSLKVLLQSDSNSILEASVHLYPEKISELSLKNVSENIQRIVLRDMIHKTDLIDYEISLPVEILKNYKDFGLKLGSASHIILKDAQERFFQIPYVESESPISQEEAYFIGLSKFYSGIDATSEFCISIGTEGLRATSLCLLGMQEVRKANYKKAIVYFEESLFYNAEDPQVWWHLAFANRLIGNSSKDSESTELLNAHYLSPLEPILKVESFLTQDHYAEVEVNNILKSLIKQPDYMIEAACVLAEIYQWSDLARLIYEVSKQCHIPTLNYIQAWTLLKGSNLDVESAKWVQKSENDEIDKSFLSWRPIEKVILYDLSKHFDKNQQLKELLKSVNIYEI